MWPSETIKKVNLESGVEPEINWLELALEKLGIWIEKNSAHPRQILWQNLEWKYQCCFRVYMMYSKTTEEMMKSVEDQVGGV